MPFKTFNSHIHYICFVAHTSEYTIWAIFFYLNRRQRFRETSFGANFKRNRWLWNWRGILCHRDEVWRFLLRKVAANYNFFFKWSVIQTDIIKQCIRIFSQKCTAWSLFLFLTVKICEFLIFIFQNFFYLKKKRKNK